jgi:hypothetical protein
MIDKKRRVKKIFCNQIATRKKKDTIDFIKSSIKVKRANLSIDPLTY